MDTEVIRQFLVSIGVQVDEKGLKRFDNTIKDITKTTKEFAEVLTAAAVAASVAVVKISEQFEDLYYASQRLHSSVENIKAFTFGVSQMGGNADAARQSLEAFASFLRNNPAGAGVVRGFFGVDVSDKDAAGGLAKIGRRVRDMQAQGAPYWQIQQRAAMVGIDENTLQAMLRGTDQWSDQFHDVMRKAGVDMDALAASSTNLMQGFRKLTVEVEAHFLGLLQKIRPEVLEAGVVIAAIAGTLGAVALLLGGVAAEFLAVGVAVALLVDDFNAWRNGGGQFDWGEWANDIDLLVAALKDVWGAFGEAAKAAWAFHDVLSDEQWDRFGHGLIRILSDLLHMFADLTRAAADFANMDFKKMGHDLAQLWRDGEDHPFADHSKDAPGESRQARARAMAGTAPANSNVAGNATQKAMAYFMRQGWTREQAAGIVANLNAESGLKVGAVGDGGRARGIGQWHPDRQADFARFSGKDLSQASLMEQLAFVNYELTKGRYAGVGRSLRGMRGAAQAGALVSSRYESPADVHGEMILRGRAAQDLLTGTPLTGDGGARVVTIQSKTDVTIHGATDPNATAKATGDAIDQSNAALVRNTKTAVR